MSATPSFATERPGLFRRSLHLVYGTWFVTVFTTLSAISLCLIAVLPGQSRRRGVAKQGAALVFRLTGAWPKVRGLENLPPDAAVVVANHASYPDGVLLTAVLPHRYRFVIKKEITEVPLVHFFLQRIGAHFVERFDPRRSASDARRILQTARSGESLAFFPEGTFRAEPGLRPFRAGTFTIAARSNMPVVPLTIRGTRQMLPAHRWLPQPARLDVHIHEPLHETAERPVAEVLDYARLRILEQLDEPDLVVIDRRLG